MNATTKTTGFYATDSDTFYLTPTGRVWLVASEDDLPEVREVPELDPAATSADGLLTPEECMGYCRQVQDAGGETLIGE